MGSIWRTGICGLALLLAGCVEQEAVYRFDGAGGVEIDAVLRLDTGLLGEMTEDETGELVSEALFGVLGDRRIERTEDGWRSEGPPVPVARLGALLGEQRVRFEEVAGGWRFISGAGDMSDWIEAEVRDACRSEAPVAEVADFCEQVVGLLVAPDGAVGADTLPEQLPADLGVSREELAGVLMLVRSQLAKMTLRVDLHGPVRDVVGFDPLPGGGWTFSGSLYDLLGRTFAWTVPGPAVPAGRRGADAATSPEETARRAGAATDPLPTPVASALLDMSGGEGSEAAYGLLGVLGDGSGTISVAVACMPGGALQAAAEFGGYPPDGQPVQLAVRTADGRVERFGPVERGPSISGSHAPLLADPAEAWRFAAAALGDGSLISNGFRSLWNRAGPAGNAEALQRLRACMQE